VETAQRSTSRSTGSKQPRPLTLHRHLPDHFHLTIGSHEPALTIADGDRVITTTLDGDGRDEQYRQITEPGNPQTGPFQVEGAAPGDLLRVELHRLTPNRRLGYSSAAIAQHLVEPSYLPDLPESKYEQTVAEWEVDPDGGIATLLEPRTTLPIQLPLTPMLGCFGVAPAGGQAISATTCGEHGGNMDYRGYGAGVTAYLPVFVPGALLHVGDVHALQGEGEIVGSGVEISAEVEFSVSVVKSVDAGWPRGETDEQIFTVGNARPLERALQHATTEMLKWLQGSFGLDKLGANILLGQSAEYDVGNVYSPAYTLACKVRKDTLRGRPG
jgi:acetamidase/formamidase